MLDDSDSRIDVVTCFLDRARNEGKTASFVNVRNSDVEAKTPPLSIANATTWLQTPFSVYLLSVTINRSASLEKQVLQCMDSKQTPLGPKHHRGFVNITLVIFDADD